MLSLKALVFRLISLLLLIGLAVFTACEPSDTITEDIQPCNSTSIIVSGRFVALDPGAPVGGIPYEIQHITQTGWFSPIARVVKARGSSADDGSYTACITPKMDEISFNFIPLVTDNSVIFCPETAFYTDQRVAGDTITLTTYTRSLVSCDLTVKSYRDLPLAQEATMHISWSATDSLHPNCVYSGSARLSRKRKERTQTVYLPAGTAVRLSMLKTTEDHPDRISEMVLYPQRGTPMRVELEW